MRIVIDTNSLIAALTKPRGSAARIIKHWRGGAFDLVLSEDTFAEAHAVLGGRWLERVVGYEAVAGLMAELRNRSILVPTQRLGDLPLRDKGDRSLVETAVAGGARYLVTSDREVLLLRGYGDVEFVTASDFLRTNLMPRDQPDSAGGPAG
jgi:putative PIN family toxin of toxin-antitoxin system